MRDFFKQLLVIIIVVIFLTGIIYWASMYSERKQVSNRFIIEKVVKEIVRRECLK